MTTQCASDPEILSGPSSARARSTPDTGTGFRADIEGLRAVAVVLVVLGHAGVSWFAGGYVGVDVFFVISGFLITTLLAKELTGTGRISISRFYARRAVRLLPASSTALAATLAGAWLWLSPLRFTEFANDALASAFYVINVRLAVTGTDYLAAEATPSPYQHFWSLAVEEQFYLVWPVLMMVAALVGRRLFAGRRRGRGTARAATGLLAVAVALSVLTIGSFVLSVTETQRSAPWAYFGAHTRAWELGLGAMVALSAAWLRRLPAPLAGALTWAGLVAVGAAAMLYDGATAFPGTAAALPVLGAAMIVAGGCAAPSYGAERLLRCRPFQVVGKLSYGWYLWHWPMLMIAPAALGIEPGILGNLALSGVGLGLAALSLRFVENPIRHRRTLRTKPVRGIGLGLSLSATTAAIAVFAATVPPTLPAGAAAADLPGLMARSAEPAAVLSGFVAGGAGLGPVPANLRPTLTEVKSDMPAVYRDGCHLDSATTAPPGPCAYGDTGSETTVVLFGDSHAAQWFPALEKLAIQRRWKLVSLTKSGCPAPGVLVWNKQLKRGYTECDTWRAAMLRQIERLRADLVVVSSYVVYADTASGPGSGWSLRWQAGWERTLSALGPRRRQVVVIGDTPNLAASAPQCVAQHATQVGRCAERTAAALHEPELRADAAELARRAGATVIDPVPWLCADTCPVVLGNLLVYRDAHHLTTAFAATLAPLIGAQMKFSQSD